MAAGYRFEVHVADVDETPQPGERADELVVRLARAKASAVAALHTSGHVLGGDTVVVRDGEILGKPNDSAAAGEMLRSLAGREHEVLSGVALIDAATGLDVHGLARSRVAMDLVSPETLADYLAGDEWRGKAGAYAIQGDAGAFMHLQHGELDTVIGLPVKLVRQLFERLGTGEHAS
ncbi:MAG: hypothetical protein DHS20C15_00330 [Planctomycetota bacterium]|nr:MAG: hypothetical protein DHS20C15_00330 [Planctomycetota bacterium]